MGDDQFIFDFESYCLIRAGSLQNINHYCISYIKEGKGTWVEIGDGVRHYISLSGVFWNRILKIIKNKEIDDAGIDAIISGLMSTGIPDNYKANFLRAINEGKVPEVKTED